MQVVHHVACNFDKVDQSELAALGISVGLGVDAFDLVESGGKWQALQPWISRRRPVVTTSTKFTKPETDGAEYLQMTPAWHHGYPMPDMDNGYLELTYEAGAGCQRCGIGIRQVNPFRMKGEPKWGKRQILQLNWVFDEYFVTPGMYHTVFEPFGIKCRQVLQHRTGKPLQTVVQLAVDTITQVRLDMEKPFDALCSVCGQGKYHPHTRGFFPRLSEPESAPIFKSREHFGSGASAWRAIIVSQEVYRAMSAHDLKGVSFYPLAD